MTPEEIIKEASSKLPERWPDMKHGGIYLVPVMPETFHKLEKKISPEISFDCVEFKIEFGYSHYQYSWRLKGKYKNTEVVITEGRFN